MCLHRAPTATALLLAATFALSACSDDERDSPEPSPTPSSTSASPTATPSAKPTEPVLPEAAKEATEAGARAFITYYWDLINYAQVTGDVKALKKASGPNCGGCRGGIDAVRRLYRDGGSATGGTYEVEIGDVREIKPADKTLTGIEARYEVRNSKQTITRGNGSSETSKPGTTAYLSYLIWLDGAWRTDVLEPR